MQYLSLILYISTVAEAARLSNAGRRQSSDAQPLLQAEQGAVASELPIAISKHLVWLEYLVPSAAWWNVLHDGHVDDGGLWHYDKTVQHNLEQFVEQRHPSYDSLWDIASNQGFFLERLAEKHPERKFYGSDISSVMVNATKTRCPTCRTGVFDLANLESPDNVSLPSELPSVVDIVVVADVIVYLSWGGWPPILNTIIPAAWTRPHREHFWRHLTNLARKEVIFSNHQGNKGVLRFFQQMGATKVEKNGVEFWVARGTHGDPNAMTRPLPMYGAEVILFHPTFLVFAVVFATSGCLAAMTHWKFPEKSQAVAQHVPEEL